MAFLKKEGVVCLCRHRGQRISRAHHLKPSASPLNNQSLHDLAVNFVMTNYVGDETSPAIGSNGPTSTEEMR